MKESRNIDGVFTIKCSPFLGFPPNILPDEILKAGEKRVRAVFVDSCNPLLTYPDTPAYEEAFKALDLLVVVDVAMTETARLADYILPAHTQFENGNLLVLIWNFLKWFSPTSSCIGRSNEYFARGRNLYTIT